MGILKKLGFVYDEESETKEQKLEDQAKPTEQPVEPKVEQKKPLFSENQVTTLPGQVIGVVDEKVYQSLSESIEKNDLPGNDFLEFMTALQNLSSMAVEEKSKFAMVFTTLNTTADKLTKEKLLSSIDHYLGVIEKEKEIFQSEMSNATTNLVTANEKQFVNNNNLIQTKLDLITKTQQEISEITVVNQDLAKMIEQNKFKIAKKEADFSITSNKVIEQITGYKQKINEYIN